LQANQRVERERERAQKLEQENQEFKRKLAEIERENTEKENFINTLQEVQARKNQTLEKKVLESNRRRDQAVLKSKKDKQQLRRQETTDLKKRTAGVFDLAPENAVPPSISELGMASSGTEEVATTDSIAQENEILQDAAANSNGKRGPKKSKLLVLDSTTVSFVPTETRQAMNSEGELVDIGGSQYSSQMCIAFWINWASEGLRALTTVGTSHANTLEAAAVSVTIKPKPKNGCKTRKRVDITSKPVNAVGAASGQTIRLILDHMHLAMDRMLYQEQLVKNATVVHLQIDSSTFNPHAMMGALVTLMLVEKIGKDALGNPMWALSKRAYCLNSFACANKISQDVKRKDGKGVHRKEASYRLSTMLLISGLIKVLKDHQCVLFGLDRGSEGVGAGKGKKWKAKRDAFIGRGSYIEQIFLTFESVVQVLDGIAGYFVIEIMDFLGVPREDQKFTTRLSPDRMDISQPVRRVEMHLVLLKREIDPQDAETKRKIVKSSQVEKLNSSCRKVSTERHPLAKYPLIKGGCPDAEWCDKHALNTAVLKVIKILEKHYKDAMKMIRLIRNPYIWKKLLC
jgi:hypothetical protein